MSQTASLPLKISKRLPGPRGWDAFKVGFDLRADSLGGMKRLRENYGEFVFLPYPRRMFFLFHPESIQYVLKENHKNYTKSKNYKYIMPLLGKGLVTSEGELWRSQRKVVGKEFSPSSISTYIERMHDYTIESFQELNGHEIIDISSYNMKLTLRIATEIFFGINVSEQSDHIGEAMKMVMDDSIRRVYSLYNIPLSIPTPNNRKVNRALKSLDKVVYDLIEKKQGSSSMLSKLIQSNDKMGVQQLRDEIMTLMMAGHETTSNTLTWCLYLLSQNPDKLALLKEEVNSFTELRPDMKQLNQLNYMQAVLFETMRMLPSVPMLSRQPIEDDYILGHRIPKGTVVSMSQYVTHNDPAHWERPDQFLPERFIDTKPRPGIYFPFAEGPRKCVGEEFSLVESKLILFQFLKKFDFEYADSQPPQLNAAITLKPAGPLRLKIKQR